MGFDLSDKNNFNIYNKEFELNYDFYNKKSNHDYEILEKINFVAKNTTLDNSVKFETDKLYNSINFDPFTIDEYFNIRTVIKFDQNEINCENKNTLKNINLKFNGLCEFICNKILIEDLLGNEDRNFLRNKINADALNQESILNTHLLNIYSVFQKMIAFLFGIYPDNIFSIKNQWNLVKHGKVNKEILFKGLEEIESGATLKLQVFKRTLTSFNGHSLLVKKINEDNFIFFDPNSGEYRDLSKNDLEQKINDQLIRWEGTDLFLTKGNSYIKKLKERNIIKIFKNTIK